MSVPARVPALTLPQPIADAAGRAHQPVDLHEEVVGLFDELRDRVLRYTLGFRLPVPDAEEIVQDVFLALFQHLAQRRSRSNLRAWLFRVAHNLSLKRRQALLRTQAGWIASDEDTAEQEIADPSPGPEDQLATRQRQLHLQAVVRALPETDRQCLSLRAEGLRYREIAEVLGISLGGVANSLARSLARLNAADERGR